LVTHPELIALKPTAVYVPRCYGFKVSKESVYYNGAPVVAHSRRSKQKKVPPQAPTTQQQQQQQKHAQIEAQLLSEAKAKQQRKREQQISPLAASGHPPGSKTTSWLPGGAEREASS
jgi:hypothetical protein